MKNWHTIQSRPWFPYLAVALVSALVYLPHILQLGFYRDDWYYIADGYFGGPKIFHTMFWIDRPARGYVFEFLFRLFGTQASLYHFLMWVWRCAAGLFAVALFQAIWPRQPRRNLLISLIFVLYPGFLWWVSGVEYQPMVLSLAIHTASFWFSILVLKSTDSKLKFIWLAMAIFSGAISIWLVDYALGMEVFRWVCIYLFLAQVRHHSSQGLWRKVALHSLVSLPIAGSFLLWKLFVFSGVRNETDIVLQLTKFVASPLEAGLGWLVSLLRSLFNVLINAWAQVLDGSFFALGSAEKGLVLFLTVLAVLAILAVLPAQSKATRSEAASSTWARNAILGGLVGIVGGAFPIVVMSRTILIQEFSHYALPVSLCVALLAVGFLSYIQPASVRQVAAVTLLAVGVLATHSHAVTVIQEEQKVSAFWQGFMQRVTGLTPGTALIVNFPGIDYREENDIVWAPANLIYLPADKVRITDGYIEYVYTGASMHPESLKFLKMQGVLEESYRSHVLMVNFANVLVASQPTLHSCVHVMDGRWPRLSAADGEFIMFAAPYSQIDQIEQAGVRAAAPGLFGPGLSAGWCDFYYQAETAVQGGDWPSALASLQEALAGGYGPADSIEWMPFLQSAMAVGDLELIRQISGKVPEDVFFDHQACQLPTAMQAASYPVSAEVLTLTETLFCQTPVPENWAP